MKNLYLFAFLALFIFAAGCGKSNYQIPQDKNKISANQNVNHESKQTENNQTKPKENNNMNSEYKTVVIKTEGMSCSHCENSVKTSVSKLDGVKEVIADAKTNTAKVTFDENKTNLKAIENAITDAGYGVLEPVQ